MKDASPGAEVTSLCPNRCRLLALWLLPHKQGSTLTWKTSTGHRKLKVTSVSSRSLAHLSGSVPPAAAMSSETHTCSSFAVWPRPGTFLLHTRNDTAETKNFYFSKVCLRPTDTCKTFSTSETKPTTAGEFTGAQKSFLTFFLAKNRRQRWAIGHSKKQMCNALLWWELCVPQRNTEQLSTSCVQDRICCFFLPVVSALRSLTWSNGTSQGNYLIPFSEQFQKSSKCHPGYYIKPSSSVSAFDLK